MNITTPGRAMGTDATQILTDAIETFVCGFSFTRSFTHPYLVERIGSLWVTYDAPRTSGRYRNEEWFAFQAAPEQVDRLARQRTRGRYAICAICGMHEDDEALRVGYRALGYRLSRTEPLMIHDLRRIPQVKSPARVERVRHRTVADELAKAARARQILPEHLGSDAPLRQYVARIDGEMVGWVRSIEIRKATCCSEMYVMPTYRRRGVGRALLGRLLRDDRKHEASLSVLTASHTGAKLYTAMGYRQIGTVMVYTPKRA